MFRTIFIIALLVLSGCATGTKTVLVDKKITEPKVIALNAPRTPWVVEIESRLRQKGYKVLRWASQKRVKEQVSERRTEEFREASARYVLSIEGFAPLGVMHRCVGGGYNFQYITAELIDTNTNETIVTISGSGHSENCFPLSGTVFTDIISGIDGVWQ
ncbi:MAG: hypothetical protein Q8L56_08975 [Rhodocyclaceae bacterium]|nr:hypothetical protein [Rhodocyclaceae bacterium]